MSDGYATVVHFKKTDPRHITDIAYVVTTNTVSYSTV